MVDLVATGWLLVAKSLPPDVFGGDSGMTMAGKTTVRLMDNEFGIENSCAVHVKPAAMVLPLDPFHMVDDVAALVLIKQRLKSAGVTLKNEALPQVFRGLAGQVSNWPDVIHDRSDQGAWENSKVRRAKPGPRQIDELQEVLGWLLWLGPVERKVVHACMVSSLRKVAAVNPEGWSHETVRRVFNRGVSYIFGRLLIEHALSAKRR